MLTMIVYRRMNAGNHSFVSIMYVNVQKINTGTVHTAGQVIYYLQLRK